MKVLVPTDFSSCAMYAFKTACLLAERVNVELHIYHAADLPAGWESLPEVERYYEMTYKAIEAAAIDKLNALKKIATDQGIECVIHCRDHGFLSELKVLVKDFAIDLVIMGSHGISGKSEWFMGSNTQKALRKLDANVLVVKDELPKLDFSKVLFTTNLMVEDRDAFRHFLEFCRMFSIEEVHILTIDTSSFFNTPAIVTRSALADFAEIARSYSHKCFTHQAKDFSVDRGIRNFATKHNIQLIGISNHQKRPVRNFLFGSTVETIVNHANIPILSIDYKEEKIEETNSSQFF